MLQAIRSRAGSFAVKILFGLLIFSFLGWGVAGYLANLQKARSDNTIEIGPQKVSQRELNRELKSELNRYNQELQRFDPEIGELDRDQLLQMGFFDTALDQVIANYTLSLEADKLGLSVSDSLLSSTIRKSPEFANEKGEFERDRYNALLARANLTEASFVASARRDTKIGQLLSGIAEGAYVPVSLVDRLYIWRAETREASAITLPLSNVKITAKPSDADLAKYYTANPDQFTAPETRDVTYILISPGDFSNQVAIRDDEIEAAYKQRAEEFNTPEKRHVENVLFDQQDQADAARAAILGGKDFLTVVEDAKLKPGDLGDVAKSDLPPNFADAVFADPEPGVTPVLKSDLGWTIFRVTAITPAHSTPLEQVRGRIENDLKQTKATDEVYNKANRVDELIDGGATLEQIAEELALKSVTITGVDRYGKDAAGQPIVNLPVPDVLLEAAFRQDKGETSHSVEIKKANQFLVVRTNTITAPHLQSLATLKDKAIDAWTSSQQANIVADNANTIAQKMRSGTTIDLVAKAEKLTVRMVAAFTRDNRHSGLPGGIASRLFAAKAPGAVAIGQDKDGNYIIAQLTKITHADPAKDVAQRTAFQLGLKDSMEQDLVTQFDHALAQRYPAKLDRGALSAGF